MIARKEVSKKSAFPIRVNFLTIFKRFFVNFKESRKWLNFVVIFTLFKIGKK